MLSRIEERESVSEKRNGSKVAFAKASILGFPMILLVENRLRIELRIDRETGTLTPPIKCFHQLNIK